MSALLPLSEYPYNAVHLSDGKWKRTDYYEICCNSELFGCAFLVSIDKEVTENPNEALIYLLARLVVEGELWDEALQDDMSAQDVARYSVGMGYLAHDKGEAAPVTEFLANFREICNGIAKEKNAGVTKNGISSNDFGTIRQEELRSAVRFADLWNNRQYFVETTTEWFLFTWGTGA